MVRPQILRIIDANINRICEGLRVLEDISRFIHNDPGCSRELKSIRHSVRSIGRGLGTALESARDAENDIGAEHDITHMHYDLTSIIRANAKRIEEGLRVIEELSKLPGMGDVTKSDELKKYRYSIYTLSRNLILKTPCYESTSLINGIYVIIPVDSEGFSELPSAVKKIINAGARIIALRGTISDSIIKHNLKIFRNIFRLCERSHVLFFLHDLSVLASLIKPHGLCIENERIRPALINKALHENIFVGKRIVSTDQFKSIISKRYDFAICDMKFAREKIIKQSLQVHKILSPMLIPDISSASDEEIQLLLKTGTLCLALTLRNIDESEAVNKIQEVRRDIEKQK